MNILLFGPNGSGKGTQGALLRRTFGLQHLESGAVFREHISRGTDLGRTAKGYIDRGELVPDGITIPMVLDVLEAAGPKGWLLDGFPRSIAQAERLWEALTQRRVGLDAVVEIELDHETAQTRILGRRLCAQDPNHPNNVSIPALLPVDGRCRVCGGELKVRSDDQDLQAIERRHHVYYDRIEGTLAAVDYFRRLAPGHGFAFIELDGSGPVDAIQALLLEQLQVAG